MPYKIFSLESAHIYINHFIELTVLLIFLHHSLHVVQTIFRAPILKAFGSLKLAYLTQSLNDYNESAFTSPKLVQLFNRFATLTEAIHIKRPQCFL